ALTAGTLSVSATTGNGRPVSRTCPADPPRANSTPVRPVQLMPQGPIGTVHGTDPTIHRIAQPGLADVDLVGSAHGWRVAGTDNGQSAVSVSKNSGSTWTTAPLGAKVATGSVSLATADGTNVYALAQTGAGAGARLALFRSTDGGASWGG